MKFIIDEDIIKKKGLEFNEFLTLLLLKNNCDLDRIIEHLIATNKIVHNNGKLYVTQRWSDDCDDILLTNDNNIPKDYYLLCLAEKMMEIFPKGNKNNTPYKWRGNKREVTLKLKKFFKLYGNYSDEEILDATRRYVDSFNGNYTYMCLLKYFIHKDKKVMNEDGIKVEEISELAAFLENKEEDNDSNTFDELI